MSKRKKHKKIIKKKHKSTYGISSGLGMYFVSTDDSDSSGSSDGGIGESIIAEAGKELSRNSVFAAAKTLFNSLLNKPEITRADIIDAFMDNLGVTESTATTYFQRIAKEMGLTGLHKSDNISKLAKKVGGGFASSVGTPDQPQMLPTDQNQPEEPTENQQDKQSEDSSTLPFVKGAHLVYKRENGEGSFEELWVYPNEDLSKSLKIQKEILAHTDIPPNETKSQDGNQTYTLITMGNANILHIDGLPN